VGLEEICLDVSNMIIIIKENNDYTFASLSNLGKI
jgi:hypothetical protein